MSLSFLLVSPSKKPPTIKGDKMRKHKQGSTRLKVVQTNTFMFHLTQDFVWDKMPMGQFKRSIDIGVKDGTENYLDYIKDTYNIKPKENIDEKTKTLN